MSLYVRMDSVHRACLCRADRYFAVAAAADQTTLINELLSAARERTQQNRLGNQLTLHATPARHRLHVQLYTYVTQIANIRSVKLTPLGTLVETLNQVRRWSYYVQLRATVLCIFYAGFSMLRIFIDPLAVLRSRGTSQHLDEKNEKNKQTSFATN